MRRLDFEWELMNSVEMKIFRIRKKLRTIVDENLQDYGLTAPQLFILLILKKEGTIKSAQLAHFISVKPSAITIFVDKLVEMNLVKRETSKTDRRVINLSLNESGEEMLREILAKHNALLTKKFEFTQEELEDLSRKLDVIEKAADEGLMK